MENRVAYRIGAQLIIAEIGAGVDALESRIEAFAPQVRPIR